MWTALPADGVGAGENVERSVLTLPGAPGLPRAAKQAGLRLSTDRGCSTAAERFKRNIEEIRECECWESAGRGGAGGAAGRCCLTGEELLDWAGCSGQDWRGSSLDGGGSRPRNGLPSRGEPGL